MTPKLAIAQGLYSSRCVGTSDPTLTDMLATMCEAMCEADAKFVLEALDAAGYVVVPKEPTEIMVEAGRKALFGGGKTQTHARVMWVWEDMLAARPKED